MKLSTITNEKGVAMKVRNTHSIIRELSLDDMLMDPITKMVMRRDGVSESDIRALAEGFATQPATGA